MLYYLALNSLQLYCDSTAQLLLPVEKFMVKTRLTLLTIAFTLACIGRTHAIGITINQGNASSSVWLSDTMSQAQVVALPHEAPSYEFDTFASVRDSFSAATWGFTNHEQQAMLYSHTLLHNQGDPLSSEILAWASTSVQFTLTESVDYLFQTTFLAIPNGNGASARVFAEFYSSGGPYIYFGAAQTTSVGLLSLPEIGIIGSDTGTLTPGTYGLFLRELVYQTNGGTLIGDFALILSRPHGGGNNVPDAGSTMIMLGMALCTLGGIALGVKA